MKVRRVLIVDDEPAVCRALEKALTRAGHTVMVAPSGEQACDLLAIHEVDAILMDLRMPSMSGQTLFQAIDSYVAFLNETHKGVDGRTNQTGKKEGERATRLKRTCAAAKRGGNAATRG